MFAILLVVLSNNKRLDDMKADFNRRFEAQPTDFGRRFDEIIQRLERIEAKPNDHERRITRPEERTPTLVRA